MRWVVAAAMGIACAASGTAEAKPGQTPTYSYRLRLLTDDEQALLARGQIGDGQQVGGGLVGTFVGFGLGHAVQGRFIEKGWIFAAGDAVATALVVKFIAECAHTTGEESCDDHDDWLAAGLVIGIAVRIWQVADVWYGPTVHNDKIRELRWRAGVPPPVSLQLAPAAGGGGTAGITLRF